MYIRILEIRILLFDCKWRNINLFKFYNNCIKIGNIDYVYYNVVIIIFDCILILIGKFLKIYCVYFR